MLAALGASASCRLGIATSELPVHLLSCDWAPLATCHSCRRSVASAHAMYLSRYSFRAVAN